MFKKYKEVSNLIDLKNITKKDKIIAILLSVILSILILIGPIVILINLLIFVDYLKLIAFMITTLIALIMPLSECLYLNLIAKDVKGKIYVILIDMIIPIILCYIVYIILIIVGVI